MDNNIKETILFVDDEESILDIANEYFGQKGYNVVTASNGIEAIEVLEKEKIDCCFTDINMPRMDGLELAEHIRIKDNTIPVIIMTGFPSLDNTIKTLKNGVVDFLVKPVNLNQMELCVKRVLRERRLFVDNILLKQEVEKKKQLAELNWELKYKVDELNALNKIMRSFTVINKSFDVFKCLVDMAVEITQADESKFYIIDTAAERSFEVASFTGQKTPGNLRTADPGLPCFNTDSVSDRLIMDVALDKTPLLINENQETIGLPPGMFSFMIAPMTIRNKIFGVLTASVKNCETKFTEQGLYFLTFMTRTAAYAIENLALYENVYENLVQVLEAFVKAQEAKDPYTEQHSYRVTLIAAAIAKEMGCTAEELDIINVAGRLHDVGKIGIRDEILLKPGRLTDEEFEHIKKHPVIGADIVGKVGLWDKEREIIKYHHERFDGSGYPCGKKAEEIPLLARILSVADVYDAMASDRIYRKKMEEEKVLKIINKGAGTQFDPDAVSTFMKLYNNGKISEIP
ncbi:MAG: response regulator [Desulfobacterales bacterium]|nr:response regulator [Desulfobacterales bacterium]